MLQDINFQPQSTQLNTGPNELFIELFDEGDTGFSSPWGDADARVHFDGRGSGRLSTEHQEWVLRNQAPHQD